MEQPRVRNRQTRQNRGVWHVFGNFMNHIGLENREKRNTKSHVRVCEYNSEACWTLLKPKTLVSGVVLSLWDHICGPREEQVWYRSDVPRSVLLLNAPFTLQGQMKNMHDLADGIIDENAKSRLDMIEDKFLVLSEYFSSSLIFCAKYNDTISTFSLSFIFNKEKVLHKYIYMHHIVRDRMSQLVEMYKRVSAEENPMNALSVLDEALPEVLCGLYGLFSSSPMPQVLIGKTLFAKPKLEVHVKSFLATVVTSHLQTGCTLVVGHDEKLVGEWVDTLSLFLLPHQRHFSRPAITHGSQSYIPDLALQGLVIFPNESIKDDQIIKSMFPTTLVVLQGTEPGVQEGLPKDNTGGTGSFFVKQTHPYHEYVVIRHDYQEEQRRRLAHTSKAEGNLWDATEDLFRPVQSSQVIADFLDKVEYIPHDPPYLRQGYLSQIMTLLIRKAMVLIKYVEALGDMDLTAEETPDQSLGGSGKPTPSRSPVSNRGVSRVLELGGDPGYPSYSRQDSWSFGTSTSENSISSYPPPVSPLPSPPNPSTFPANMEPRETKRRIRMDLGLNEGCYFVLLGIAEKLKPGTFIGVAGNPAWIEEKLIELFERF